MTPDAPGGPPADPRTPAGRRLLGSRAALALGAAALFAVPFALLAAAVLSGSEWLESLDQGTADRLHELVIGNPAALDTLRVLAVVTEPWTMRAVALVVAIGLWRAGLRRATIWLAVTMAVGGLLSLVLKLVVARARPSFDDPAAIASGYSFPSGHALNSMLLAACLLVLFHRRTHGAARAALWAGAVVLVLVTGYDRIALGVHFVSDVVAGWVVALATVAACLAAIGTGSPAATAARPGARATATTSTRSTAQGTARPGWWRALGGLAGRLVASWAVIFAILVGLGLLVTKVLVDVWPLTAEDGVNRAFEANRTPLGNDVTFWMSELGNTGTVVGLAVLGAIVLRLWRKRWREGLFVILAPLGQSVVFLCTTLVIDRDRPDVDKLDQSPPTSSFPSGHTSASIAIYVALAVTVHRTVRRNWLRRMLIGLLLLLPVLVGTSRLYRGMHHPSDLVGALVNSTLVLLATDRALRATDLPDDERGVPPTAGPDRPARTDREARDQEAQVHAR